MLEFKNISYDVSGESGNSKEILKNINLTIEDNKLVVITGPNGGGKSTMAKMLAGIVRPTAGSILLDGEDITAFDITERAKCGISLAFQTPVRFKGLTVQDLINIAAGKRLSTIRACEYLSEVGLCAKDYIGREINASLSGGELKRIEIAMIMARGTRVSIFDEPEAGIDLWSFQNLIQAFEKMHRTVRGTIIIISHQERILNIADEIIVVAEGGIRETGAKERILPGLMDVTAVCGKIR